MRKLVVGLLFAVVLSMLVVSAQVTCTDTDEAPNPEDSLTTVAEVKYGITPKTDECVSGRDGYHKDPSAWVREYYCTTTRTPEGANITQRAHKDYECARYGFEKCEGGKCVGGATSAGTSVKKPSYEPPRCGDKKIQADLDEQCDPPDDICYVNEQIGICTRPVNGFGGCQCKLYKGGAVSAPSEEPNETTAAPVEETPPAGEEKEEDATEEREPLPTGEVEEPRGVGFTRSIANAVKRFFAWIGSWFD